MEGPVLLQDWVTIHGDRKASNPYTLYPHRDTWLWAGNAQAVMLTVEVKDVVYGSGEGDPKPTLSIETAACENGPWSTIETFDAPTLDPPGTMIHLRRDPNAAQDRRLAGYLRWSITQPSAVTTAAYNWAICFRIVAVVEGIG